MSGGWNYRMTVQTVPDGAGGTEEVWAVRELYYDADGHVIAWSENPDHPQGETVEELRDDMERYVDAVRRPAWDLDQHAWRTPKGMTPPLQPDLFEPIGHRGNVRCRVCGASGQPGARWQEAHRRGHGSCPRCGSMQTLKLNGSPRIHARCPGRPE